MIDAVLDRLSAATLTALGWVLGLLSDTVFTSPDVTALPQVGFLTGRAQTAANAALGLIVTMVGLLAMTHGSLQDRYALKDLLPRMLLGFLGANMATPVVSWSIAAANALTGALTAGGIGTPEAFGQIRRVVGDATAEPAHAIAVLLLRELAVVLLAVLVVTWLGRLAVLIVVAATGPLALLGLALPQTEAVPRIWGRTLLSCLLVQVLQAVTLHAAVATLLSGEANAVALGFPHDPTGLFALLLTCFLLWLVIRVPRWVARTLGTAPSRATGLLASLVKVVAVQRLVAVTGLRGGRGRARGARVAGLRAAPATHLHQHAASHHHEHLHVHAPRDPAAARDSTRPAYWAGDVTPAARPHPGRPPLALEGGRASDRGGSR
jgi:hypothetical protein